MSRRARKAADPGAAFIIPISQAIPGVWAESKASDLGKDAESRRLEAGGARGFDGLHHPLTDLLDGLGHERAHKAYGPEGIGQIPAIGRRRRRAGRKAPPPRF